MLLSVQTPWRWFIVLRNSTRGGFFVAVERPLKWLNDCPIGLCLTGTGADYIELVCHTETPTHLTTIDWDSMSCVMHPCLSHEDDGDPVYRVTVRFDQRFEPHSDDRFRGLCVFDSWNSLRERAAQVRRVLDPVLLPPLAQLVSRYITCSGTAEFDFNLETNLRSTDNRLRVDREWADAVALASHSLWSAS
jgi:hypothetical protein